MSELISKSVVVPRLATSTNDRLNREKVLIIFAFLIPPALIYFLLVLLPVIQAGYFSFYKWNGLGAMTNFRGLDNYLLILRDKVFLRAVTNNLTLTTLSLLVQLPLALALALLIRRNLRGRTIFRVIFFMPYVLSEVVTGVIWVFVYNPANGLLTSILTPLGIPKQGWLGDPQMVLFLLFIVISWKYFGLHLILYTAGLQNIPAELEESALIDGATGGQALRYITIPMLGPTIRLSIFLSVLGSLQIFDLIWVMTTGGPVNASQTMVTYLYNFGFRNFAIGYGSAAAVILFLICLTFSLIYQRQVMRRDYGDSA
jgi:raffinose/stachyose/melibiose transport system permease protein